MHNPKTVQTAPRPEEKPQEQPNPQEQPRRRRTILPTFGAVVATCAMVFTLGAQAQTTPQGTDKRDARTMDSPPPRTHQDAMDDQQRGWQRFDDRTATELQLDDSQKERLLELDARYQVELDEMGDDPTSHPQYNALKTRRDNELREILSPEQHQRWQQQQQRRQQEQQLRQQDRMNRQQDQQQQQRDTPDGTVAPDR
jgi:hypothetical protein